MDPFEAQVIGYAILVIITLGAFGGLILKISAPITKLQIAVEKLTPILDNLNADIRSLAERVSTHGKEIDILDKKVIKMEEAISFILKEIDISNGSKRHRKSDDE